jgi:hypothetical protein
MPPQQARVDPKKGPVSAFAFQLQMLRKAAGSPSYRKMAEGTHYSHTSLSRAAQGLHLPTWDVVKAFVEYCGEGAALDKWRVRWEYACRARDQQREQQVLEAAAVALIEQNEVLIGDLEESRDEALDTALPDDLELLPAELQRRMPSQPGVVARVAIEPGGEQVRVYWTSSDQTATRRPPGAHRRRKTSRPRTNDHPRTLVIPALVLLIFLVAALTSGLVGMVVLIIRG